MITITCDKCGEKSDNAYDFENSKFMFYDLDNALRSIHLCVSCQSKLRIAINGAIAHFVGIESIRDWEEHNTIT